MEIKQLKTVRLQEKQSDNQQNIITNYDEIYKGKMNKENLYELITQFFCQKYD